MGLSVPRASSAGGTAARRLAPLHSPHVHVRQQASIALPTPIAPCRRCCSARHQPGEADVAPEGGHHRRPAPPGCVGARRHSLLLLTRALQALAKILAAAGGSHCLAGAMGRLWRVAGTRAVAAHSASPMRHPALCPPGQAPSTSMTCRCPSPKCTAWLRTCVAG